MSTTYPDLDSYFPFADGSEPFFPAKPLAKHESEQLPSKETRLERCNRILSGQLRGEIKRASEMQFNYQTATALATVKSTPKSKGSSV